MSLNALPYEILHGIADYLDLRSVVRLTATCTSLSSPSDLIRHHMHGHVYLALLGSNFSAFQEELLKALSRLTRLGSTDGEGCRHIELHCLSQALAWQLMVVRDSTDQDWWSEWSLLAQVLIPASAFSEPEDVANISTPMMRTLKHAIEKRHLAAIKVFCKETTAKDVGHRWPDPENVLGPTLASIFANSQSLLWSAADRAFLLALLTSATSASLSAMLGSPDPSLSFEQALASTSNLGCVLELALACDRLGGHQVFSFTNLLGACAHGGNLGLFQLLINSYLVSTAAFTTVSTSGIVRINFPASTDILMRRLEDEYTLNYGTSKSAVRPFLRLLSRTSFEQVFLPYILGLRHRHIPHFLPMELDWLLSHVRIHPVTLHAVTFNDSSACPHTPDTLQLVLDHLPIDLDHFHSCALNQPLHIHRLGTPCFHCQLLVRAHASASKTQDTLPSFTSGLWFVSHDPLPESVRAADQRAVASLVPRHQALARSKAPAAAIDRERECDKYSGVPWLNFVDAKHGDFGLASKRPFPHPRATTSIRWYDPARRINQLDLRSALFAFLYEYRFDEAAAVVAKMVNGADMLPVGGGPKAYALIQSTFWVLHGMVSSACTVNSLVSIHEKERRLAGLSRITISLDQGGLVDASVKAMEEYCRFLERAHEEFRPKQTVNLKCAA